VLPLRKAVRDKVLLVSFAAISKRSRENHRASFAVCRMKLLEIAATGGNLVCESRARGLGRWDQGLRITSSLPTAPLKFFDPISLDDCTPASFSSAMLSQRL